MRELRTTAEADAGLGGSGVIFKHSPRCPVSYDVREQVEVFERAHPDVPLFMVDVIAHRPVSQHIAAAAGVVHQSPQVIVVRDGRVMWHASHYSITAGALARALGQSSG